MVFTGAGKEICDALRVSHVCAVRSKNGEGKKKPIGVYFC